MSDTNNSVELKVIIDGVGNSAGYADLAKYEMIINPTQFGGCPNYYINGLLVSKDTFDSAVQLGLLAKRR